MDKRFFFTSGAILGLCLSGISGCTWGAVYEYIHGENLYRCHEEKTPVDKDICRKENLRYEEYEEERNQLKKRS